MISTAVSFRLISDNLDRSLTQIANQPQVEREVEYYRENIGKVKSIDDFMNDARLVNFAMAAHGMQDLSYARGLIRKVLEEGVDSNTALANRLADSRFAEFATTFNFARYGSATTSFERTGEQTVQRYLRQALEVDAGTQGEGVRLSLYFERKADQIDSAYDILSDRALLQVARTALGLPDSISFLDIDRQAELLNNRINFDDFKSPEGLRDFLNRFATLWDLENPPAAPVTGALALFAPPTQGISEQTLLALRNLRNRS
jgi:hypothetical protein